MRFAKTALAVVLALTLSACTTAKKEEPIKVLMPMGATSLSLLGLYGEDQVSLDTVDGSDVISAELSKENSEYDIIIAPINLGVTLMNKGTSSYTLSHVVTWGNLFLVGTGEEALTSEGIFAAFGEKAVPQKVLESSLDMAAIVPEVTYFNSVNEVQAQLLAGKASVGLLAEPAATATIAKAKQQGLDLKILTDLQAAYQTKNKMETSGYPQAAMFVKKGSEDKVKDYIETAMKFANGTAVSNSDSVTEKIELATVEKLGIPSAEIAVKTWDRQNIHITKATDVKSEIETFMKQFNLTVK
ncbi:MAG: hypothetical protein RR490_11245, partial [Niameybacter sp.]